MHKAKRFSGTGTSQKRKSKTKVAGKAKQNQRQFRSSSSSTLFSSLWKNQKPKKKTERENASLNPLPTVVFRSTVLCFRTTSLRSNPLRLCLSLARALSLSLSFSGLGRSLVSVFWSRERSSSLFHVFFSSKFFFHFLSLSFLIAPEVSGESKREISFHFSGESEETLLSGDISL